MSRIHIHLGVASLSDSIQFYSQLFGVEPSFIETDYAKWQLQDPPLNLAISDRHSQHGVEHLGIEFDNALALAAHTAHTRSFSSVAIEEEGTVECCYALSDKYWLSDPQGVRWEQFFTHHQQHAEACCSPQAQAETCCGESSASSCC